MSSMFILGNGVSLNVTDLTLMIGRNVMGVNRIGMLDLPFRLTHYVKVDFNPNDPGDWKSEVLPHVENGENCLLWDAFRSGADPSDGNHEYIPDGIGDFSNVRYIPRCEHHYKRSAEWHEICTGLNSVVTMVIWAVELGYKEIILVGCDGYFTTPDKDHFTSDYYKEWDDGYTSRNNENIAKAHKMLVEKCPVPIYDATVGGSLNCYPKVSLTRI